MNNYVEQEGLSMAPVNLERLVMEICDEYVERWRAEGRRYINQALNRYMQRGT